MVRRLVIPTLISLAAASPISAQGARHFVRAVDEQQVEGTFPIPFLTDTVAPVTGKAVLGGTLGLVIGVVGGAAAGAAIESGVGCSSTNEQCGLLGLFAGAAIGPIFGVPAGLHLADANPHLLESLAISALVGAAGVAALSDRPVMVLVVPPARLLIALLAKR